MTKTIRFPAKTLHDLEWNRLREHIARRASSSYTAERCRELPFLEPREVGPRLELVLELMRCLEAGDNPPGLPVEDVGEWLAHVRGEGDVPGEGLRAIAANLKLYVAIARYADNRRDMCPRNAEAIIPADGSISHLSLARLAGEIETSFEPDGTISDAASPELGALRRRVGSLRAKLIASLDQIAEKEHDLLQDRNVTLRNERFVLPVRADAHRRLPGIVHGASGSGATIFVEPESTISAGNDYMLAREAVVREEKRILRELSRAVRDQLDEVSAALQATISAEVRIASARLCDELSASAPRECPPGQLDLMSARHPLLVLDGVDVVPLRLSCRPGVAIVISGPNAGGKTVVLKTVGLLGLMLAAGLPIPASPDSRMAIPCGVLTDIGDDQSLERNLSTFSAHVTNIASIIDQASENTIVLLDELAAGTDPTEGAALAEAILRTLCGRRATTLATTHFDALKSRAQESEGLMNAAVGFDISNLRPTFELRVGTPGSSSALAIARRFGITESVIEEARRLLPEGARDLSKVVEALESERQKALLTRAALDEERAVVRETQKQLDTRIDALRRKQSKFVDEETEALWTAIRKARQAVAEAEASIRRNKSDARVVSVAKRSVGEVASQLEPGKELNPAGTITLPGRPTTEEDIVPGTKVHVISLSKAGTIETAMKGNRVLVAVGPVKTRVGLEDLRVLAPSKAIGSPQRRDLTPSPAVADRSNALRTAETTIDLRGMRADEAIAATDSFLDRAMREDWPAVFVLHGLGTGALRNAIRDYLASSRYVAASRPGEREEGGDGITVVFLK